jgi:hypothetical protein
MTHDLYQTALVEMFKRVGLELTIEEIRDYASNPEWYSTKSWTQEEENAYKRWLTALLIAKTKYTKRFVEKAVNMFVFNYGWTTQKVGDDAC